MARQGKQLIVWVSDELYDAMERARGRQDRSSWLRRAIERQILKPDRPLFAPTDAASIGAPANEPAPERSEVVRW